jgi:hypothetical protein
MWAQGKQGRVMGRAPSYVGTGTSTRGGGMGDSLRGGAPIHLEMELTRWGHKASWCGGLGTHESGPRVPLGDGDLHGNGHVLRVSGAA